MSEGIGGYTGWVGDVRSRGVPGWPATEVVEEREGARDDGAGDAHRIGVSFDGDAGGSLDVSRLEAGQADLEIRRALGRGDPDGYEVQFGTDRDSWSRSVGGSGFSPPLGCGRGVEAAAFDEVDVILGPTTPNLAWKLGEKNADPVSAYLEDIYTITANLAGIPGLSMPAGFIDGLPVGVQLLAPYFQEGRLLNVAHQYQQVTEWHKQAPSGF